MLSFPMTEERRPQYCALYSNNLTMRLMHHPPPNQPKLASSSAKPWSSSSIAPPPLLLDRAAPRFFPKKGRGLGGPSKYSARVVRGSHLPTKRRWWLFLLRSFAPSPPSGDSLGLFSYFFFRPGSVQTMTKRAENEASYSTKYYFFFLLEYHL